MPRELNNNKRKSVTVQDKLHALDQIEKENISIAKIAENLGVQHSTVCAWKKDEKLINMQRERVHAVQANNTKRLRQVENPVVDQATWQWFKDQRKAGAPLSGPLIKAQATFFWQNLGTSKSFEASDGWLDKWKKRHNIRSITLSGEKKSADYDSASHYRDKFKQIVQDEGLTADQIFNADETGVNFRQMPKKSLCARSEDGAPGFKVQKERITAMACSNASGSIKLPLVVIGKSAKPRAIKNLQHLPVSYKHQKSAWMSSDIFSSWFYEEFIPFVTKELEKKKLQLKAILFADNCSAHGQNLKSGDMQVIFLPPNTTSILQPMDQGCLQNLKMIYRKKLMTFVVKEVATGKSLPEVLKSITMREVIFWLSDSWDMVTESTIIKSWKSLWPEIQSLLSSQEITSDDSNSHADYTTEFQHILNDGTNDDHVSESQIDAWLNCPTVLNEEECLTPHEIVERLTFNQEVASKNVTSSNDNTQESQSISLEDAKTSLDKLMEFCKYQNQDTQSYLPILQELKGVISKDNLSPQ